MPPPRLRIHQAACPAVCALVRGRDGLSLAPSAPAPGAAVCEWPRIRLAVASPYPTAGLSASAGGAMVLAWQPGVVQSIALPDLARAFDRRPPGLAEARGAGRANAALLRADDGWRAVVLPSLGDRISELGPGPVAISASARQVAVHAAGTTRRRAAWRRCAAGRVPRRGRRARLRRRGALGLARRRRGAGRIAPSRGAGRRSGPLPVRRAAQACSRSGAADQLRYACRRGHHDLAPGRRGRAGDLAV